MGSGWEENILCEGEKKKLQCFQSESPCDSLFEASKTY